MLVSGVLSYLCLVTPRSLLGGFAHPIALVAGNAGIKRCDLHTLALKSCVLAQRYSLHELPSILSFARSWGISATLY